MIQNAKARSIFFMLSFFSVFFLASCGSEGGSDTAPEREGKLGDTSFLLVSETRPVFADGSLKGSGSAVAKTSLGEVKGNKNVFVSFKLEEAGSLAVGAYSNNVNAGGIHLKFTRADKVLSAELQAGSKSVDISKNFLAFDASAENSFLIDFHNFETPAHILVWKGDTLQPSDTNAVFNSEKAADGASPGNGAGNFWGLALSKALVIKAYTQEAKFKHD